MNKKKLATSAVAAALSAALLLGGTFAWQSVSQTALNEASDVVNPGGRLHDDFDGENKDIYVENFADEPIFARIRLSEYLAFTHNQGVEGAEARSVVIGGENPETGERAYDIHYFDRENPADAYWTWTTGGSTVYMPTFNMNKDSLVADVNGTYAGPDGLIEPPNEDRYQDNVVYVRGERKTSTEILDADANDHDEVKTDFENIRDHMKSGYIITVENSEHIAKETASAELISIGDWLAKVDASEAGYDPETHGNYWVYDTDGWVYWSAPIVPDTATGLLLDGIELTEVMDDSWYYAIQVTAQFVTADDIGKDDYSGFYDTDAGSAPTENAERLLELITGMKLVQKDG